MSLGFDRARNQVHQLRSLLALSVNTAVLYYFLNNSLNHLDVLQLIFVHLVATDIVLPNLVLQFLQVRSHKSHLFNEPLYFLLQLRIQGLQL